MSNNEEPVKNEKSLEPDSNTITWEELERLEEAAEGGDTEAQKKLAELDGVDSYEEYKKLNQQVIMHVEQRADSGIQSILKTISKVHDPKLNPLQDDIAKLKLEADAFSTKINWETVAKGLVEADALGLEKYDLSKVSQIGNVLSKGFPEVDDLRRLVENANTSIPVKGYLEKWLKDVGLVSEPTASAIDRLSKTMEEINKSQMAELRSISNTNEALSFPGSDAFLVSYVPSPQERLREEIAEQNRLLAENNRLQRELLEKNRQLPVANVTAKAERPKQKGRYRLTAEETKFRREKVREAEKIKKLQPHKQWKEIDKKFADALNISERTFRSWRHNNY
jgi:hypothetical protein